MGAYRGRGFCEVCYLVIHGYVFGILAIDREGANNLYDHIFVFLLVDLACVVAEVPVKGSFELLN